MFVVCQRQIANHKNIWEVGNRQLRCHFDSPDVIGLRFGTFGQRAAKFVGDDAASS